MKLASCTGWLAMAFTAANLAGQNATPDPGLVLKGIIPIPNWTTAGATAESVDLSSFDPITQILYYADHVAHGVVAIDTRSNSVLGWVPVPNCTASSCPSGVQVAPDIRKLVVTDRGTHVYIYDLSLPGALPAPVTVPTAIDELDYDPIHRRVYLGNTTAPYFLTGIDLEGPKAGTVVAQIPLPGAPEQPRFSPVDGLIYLTIPTVGVLQVDPNGGAAGTGSITQTWTIANCSGNGNWIDPVTNTMLIGCNAVAGEAIVSLKDGSVLAQFPGVNRDDVLGFNPAIRRWYTGSGVNSNNGGICPPTNAGNVYPVVGVFAAGTASSPAGTLVGAACSGRGSSTLAVDPIHGDIYVPMAQYPLDPASASTGQPGFLVFHDNTAPPASPAHTQSSLGSYGKADFVLQGRTMNATATLQNLADSLTELVVSTTVGNEVVPCFETMGLGYCVGQLAGDPLVGGMTLLGNGGMAVAKGAIAVVPTTASRD
jgi:hypothetical protein